jgi:hypothetical protein
MYVFSTRVYESYNTSVNEIILLLIVLARVQHIMQNKSPLLVVCILQHGVNPRFYPLFLFFTPLSFFYPAFRFFTPPSVFLPRPPFFYPAFRFFTPQNYKGVGENNKGGKNGDLPRAAGDIISYRRRRCTMSYVLRIIVYQK